MSNSHTGNRAWAQVSGEAILRNYETLQAMAGVDAMAVVKADAYGHGVDFVAPLLRSHGVTWLGFAGCGGYGKVIVLAEYAGRSRTCRVCRRRCGSVCF